MKRFFKILGVVLFGVILIIQFIPSKTPTISVSNPDDLLEDPTISKDVASLLKNSCYDCHSNVTSFPWYASLAPAKWIINHDINEGKENLNFSEWNRYKKDEKADLLDDISIALIDDEMPLKKYTFMHPNAKLSEKEIELLIEWAETELDNLYE